MKKYIFLLVIGFSTYGIFAQSQEALSDVQLGSMFKIGTPAGIKYKHVKFPKDNMIIKRGGIANYKRLVGSSVTVVGIDNKKNGITVVTLKLKSGSRFFGSHTVVKAYIHKALKSGELQVIATE